MDTAGVVLTQEISGAPYPLRALGVPVHAFALFAVLVQSYALANSTHIKTLQIYDLASVDD